MKKYNHINRKLKVALVVPNFMWCDWDESSRWHYIPYNLCLLAAMIEDVCEVKIIDANVSNMSEAELAAELAGFKPDVVGITVLMDQYGPAGHHTAKIVKTYCNEIRVVMGGVYATMNSNKVLSDPNIDYVVIGEGEYVIKDLLGYFMGNRSVPDSGVAYRENGHVINGGHSAFIEDLNRLPLPAYHLIDFERYSKTSVSRKSVDSPRKYPYARILTSRGCPYQCIFCQVEAISGKKFRARSAENILGEIQWLKEQYGVQALIFDDDNLFTNRPRAKALFQGMIDRNLNMPWSAIAVSAFKLDDELIKLMRKSGCEYMNIAIESGNERILKKIINKPLNPAQAKVVAAKARKQGIYVAANFVIGFPTETWDEIRETIKFAEELSVDYVKFFTVIPLPNTKLWELCKTEKCLKNGFNKSKVRWNVGQIETKEFSARDLTILRAYEWDRINFSDPVKRKRTREMMGIKEEKLRQIRKKTLHGASHPQEQLLQAGSTSEIFTQG